MLSLSSRCCWLALSAAAALPAAAQSALPRPDPTDPAAATAPLSHRSALAGYRRSDAELPPLDWRSANDQVERIGGWRAYAREAAAPAPAASAPPPPAAAPAPRSQRPAAPAPAHRH